MRGKTVYLQYSTRDQIINSTTKTGEAAGNVILVSLENLDVRPLSRSKLAKRYLQNVICDFQELLHWEIGATLEHVPHFIDLSHGSDSRDTHPWYMQPGVNVTLDTLHLVFSAFGTVQKIATFEKQSGFQALVQYPDAHTAEQVSLLAHTNGLVLRQQGVDRKPQTCALLSMFSAMELVSSGWALQMLEASESP